MPAQLKPGKRVLVVMEAPGAKEVRLGVPAIGVTGQLMRELLSRAGVLNECSFSNILKHRPPGNRDPELSEITACLPWLYREIVDYNPQVIICAGKFAAKHLGSYKGSISSNVGRWKTLTIGDWSGLVVAVWHPSFLNYVKGQPAYREREQKMLAAFDAVRSALEIGTQVPEYPVKATAQPVTWPGAAAIDTEFSSLDPRTADLWLVSGYAGEKAIITAQPQAVQGVPVMHYSQADLPILVRNGMPMPKRVDDTYIAAKMLGEPQAGLKYLGRKYCHVPTEAFTEEKRTPHQWKNYAAQDAVLTWEVAKELLPRVRSEQGSAYDTETYLQPILAQCTLTGFQVNRERLGAALLAAKTKERMLAERIESVAPGLNPNSHEEKSHYLYDVLKLPAPRPMKTGHRSVGKPELRPIAHMHPIIGLLIGYSRVTKLLGTYLKPLTRQAVISTRYDIVETHRLSSSDRNLQNLPRAVKALLSPREGMCFVVADYTQIELVIAAFIHQDDVMAGMLRNKVDIHGELCRAVYGVVTPDLRTRAKSGMFEWEYGGKAPMLARILNIPVPEAQRIHDTQMAMFPATANGQERLARTGIERGYAETLDGRRRYLHDMNSTDPYLQDKAWRESINTPVQGTAAGWVKSAQVLAHAYMSQLGGYTLHQEHDSILAEVPIRRADEATCALEEAMLTVIQQEVMEYIPVSVKVKAGDTWL